MRPTECAADAAVGEAALAVRVNGVVHRLPAHSTLADLLARLGQPPEGVATAVNGRFVARDRRHEQAMCEGDQVSVFQAIVGG